MFVVLDTNHFREVAEATNLATNLDRKAAQEHAEVFLSIITFRKP